MYKKGQFDTIRALLVADTAAPLYRRLHRGIRGLILSARLRAGTRLPSTRELASGLAISRDTVEKAYLELHSEGLITRVVGRGSTVSNRSDAFLRWKHRVPPRATTPLSVEEPRLSHRGTSIVASGGGRFQLSRSIFAPSVPETRMFPAKVWARLQRQVYSDFGNRLFLHGDPQGAPSLRRAIADYLNLERGANVKADCVVVLTSAQQAFALVATMLCDAGDSIYVEDPGYHVAREIFKRESLLVRPIPVDDNGICVDVLNRIKAKGAVVYVTPSHQYPSGVTLPTDRRIKLIDWAHRTDSWIIEDDYDSEFHYEGRPIACLQGLTPYSRTFYVGSFSKSIFPSLRLAYMVVPDCHVVSTVTAKGLLDGHVATIPQLTLARFIEDGHFGKNIRMMRRLYAIRRDALSAALQRHLEGVVRPMIPSGGLQMACHLVGGRSESESLRLAGNQGYTLAGLSRLYLAGTKLAGWILGFAATTPNEIALHIRKIKHCVSPLGRVNTLQRPGLLVCSHLWKWSANADHR
jgi:GntR family transcriptional regulator/MocR family aminotransferase